MKTNLTILLFFVAAQSFAQMNTISGCFYQGLKLEKKKIYLFCRGTGSKLQLISNSFNKQDSSITHVGIGYIIENRPRIYNVTNTSGVQNAFQIDSLESFTGIHGITYFSVWEFECSDRVFKKIRQGLTSFAGKRINFDYSFLLDNEDSLYCSEFCALMINTSRNFISPTNKVLDNSLYESILNRKVIQYYPVDFFIGNNRFKKVFERRL